MAEAALGARCSRWDSTVESLKKAVGADPEQDNQSVEVLNNIVDFIKRKGPGAIKGNQSVAVYTFDNR